MPLRAQTLPTAMSTVSGILLRLLLPISYTTSASRHLVTEENNGLEENGYRSNYRGGNSVDDACVAPDVPCAGGGYRYPVVEFTRGLPIHQYFSIWL